MKKYFKIISRKKIIILLFFIVTIGFIGVGCFTKNDGKNEITISAASSLYEPLGAIKEKYESENENIKLNFNFGSSTTLAKQIVEGAEVNLFISASSKYSKELIDKKIIEKDNSKYFLNNKLVLVGRKEKENHFNSKVKGGNIKDYFEAIDGNLGLGEISSPIGSYSDEVLNYYKVKDEVKEKIIYCKDAKTILTYLDKGNIDYAMVYENYLKSNKNIFKIGEVPKESHSDIHYTISTIKGNKDIDKFVKFLNSEEGKKIFSEYGFEVL